MMYIVRQYDKDIAKQRQQHAAPRDEEVHSYNWHVGDAKPTKKGNPFDDVVEVYADGHELENVRRNYKNLPDVCGEIGGVVWRGDLAQFIYDHLPMMPGNRGLNETAHYR
jgi:hypothetical protein